MSSVIGLLKHVRSLKIVLFAYSLLYLLYLKFEYIQLLFEKFPNKFIFEVSGLFGCILSLLLIVEIFIENFKKRSRLKLKLKALKQLSSTEKEILRRYVLGQERTQFFRYSGGEVNHLVSIGALYRASTVAQMGDRFAYNIQPWAHDYLNENPELIDGESEDIRHLSQF